MQSNNSLDLQQQFLLAYAALLDTIESVDLCCLKVDDAALKNSNNPEVLQLKKSAWIVSLENTDQNDDQSIALIKDANRNLLINMKNCISVGNNEMTSDDETEFKEKVWHELFPNSNSTDFEDQFVSLTKHYSQLLNSTTKNMLMSLLVNNGYVLSDSSYFSNIRKDGDSIVLDVGLADLKIKSMETSAIQELPGNIYSRFKLTSRGFELVVVTPSNSLLQKMCCVDKININEQLLLDAQKEENESLKLTKLATNICFTVGVLAGRETQEKTMTDLITVLEKTKQLMPSATISQIEEYQKFIQQLSKHTALNVLTTQMSQLANVLSTAKSLASSLLNYGAVGVAGLLLVAACVEFPVTMAVVLGGSLTALSMFSTNTALKNLQADKVDFVPNVKPANDSAMEFETKKKA